MKKRLSWSRRSVSVAEMEGLVTKRLAWPLGSIVIVEIEESVKRMKLKVGLVAGEMEAAGSSMMQIEKNQRMLTRRFRGWLRMPILVKKKVQLAEDYYGTKDSHHDQHRHPHPRRYYCRQKNHVSWNVRLLAQSHNIRSVPLLLMLCCSQSKIFSQCRASTTQ